MYVSLLNFTGTHESNYADVSNDECRAIGYNCEGKIPGSRSSHCMCDSFGVTGKPSCGCEKGEKLISQRNYYGCTSKHVAIPLTRVSILKEI